MSEAAVTAPRSRLFSPLWQAGLTAVAMIVAVLGHRFSALPTEYAWAAVAAPIGLLLLANAAIGIAAVRPAVYFGVSAGMLFALTALAFFLVQTIGRESEDGQEASMVLLIAFIYWPPLVGLSLAARWLRGILKERGRLR